MAAVTKGSGKYFYDFERVWKETLDTGVVPFWVGKAADLLKLPVAAGPASDPVALRQAAVTCRTCRRTGSGAST